MIGTTAPELRDAVFGIKKCLWPFCSGRNQLSNQEYFSRRCACTFAFDPWNAHARHRFDPTRLAGGALARPRRPRCCGAVHRNPYLLGGAGRWPRLQVQETPEPGLSGLQHAGAAPRAACLEELRINRRTAPGIYETVVAVLGPAQAPRLVPLEQLAPSRRRAPRCSTTACRCSVSQTISCWPGNWPLAR